MTILHDGYVPEVRVHLREAPTPAVGYVRRHREYGASHEFRYRHALDRGGPSRSTPSPASSATIEDVYGHLHDRTEEGGSEVVEFRVDAYREQLGDRLIGLGGALS